MHPEDKQDLQIILDRLAALAEQQRKQLLGFKESQEIEFGKIQNLIGEIRADLYGDRDTPSLNYRIKKIEEFNQAVSHFEHEISRLKEWKDASLEKESQTHRSIRDAVIKTLVTSVVSFILAVFFAGYIMYQSLTAKLGLH